MALSLGGCKAGILQGNFHEGNTGFPDAQNIGFIIDPPQKTRDMVKPHFLDYTRPATHNCLIQCPDSRMPFKRSTQIPTDYTSGIQVYKNRQIIPASTTF